MKGSKVTGSKGLSLLVIGGKDTVESWLSTVEALDLSDYTHFKGSQSAQWKQCASMQKPRSNFAVLALDFYVYVFGGIRGKEDGGIGPELNTITVERYMPQNDFWEEFKIPNFPYIAAFSWTPLSGENEGQIAILGGTDGCILMNELWIADVKKATPSASLVDSEFDFNTGMGHLIYREKENTLLHCGGLSS